MRHAIMPGRQHLPGLHPPCGHLRLLFSYTAFMSRYDRPSHQVYMYFFLRSGWQVQFLEPDLKTPLPRKFTFADPEKIRELARLGEAWGDSESRQMLEHAIDTGRGGVYLRLTPAQYARLKRP
jgi:hypothetical protein